MNGIRDHIAEIEPEAILLGTSDGEFDTAIVGVAEVDGTIRVVYSHGKVIECLIESGMSTDEAEDWYDFNILGSCRGPGAPIFLTTPFGA